MTSGFPNPYEGARGRPSGAHSVATRRRSRPLLPLGVAVWAVLEIWLLTLVGQAWGGLTVFLILAGGLLVGALVIKGAGRRAWQQLTASVRAAQEPGAAKERPEPAGRRRSNALTMLGGLLIMVPGLLSDVLGLLLVFPPTAALLTRLGGHWLRRSTGPVGAVFTDVRAAQQQMRMRRPDGKVVPGEVLDEDGPVVDEDGRRDRRGENGRP
ncbi:FxsA family membrane protein [Streptomyces harbinensis]|uniref:FxsA family membrane protein n=1 Tax=Streptomyces harbinensis TaxID=1176198 RepID=UPI0034E013D2